MSVFLKTELSELLKIRKPAIPATAQSVVKIASKNGLVRFESFHYRTAKDDVRTLYVLSANATAIASLTDSRHWMDRKHIVLFDLLRKANVEAWHTTSIGNFPMNFDDFAGQGEDCVYAILTAIESHFFSDLIALDDGTETFEAEQELEEIAERDDAIDVYEYFDDSDTTPAQIKQAEKEVDDFIAEQQSQLYGEFDLIRANNGEKVQIQRHHFNRFRNEVGGDDWNDLADYTGVYFHESNSPKGYINIFDNRGASVLMQVRVEYLRMKNKASPTITYIAKPSDNRCSWWSMIIPQDQQLDGQRLAESYLRKGADLELKAGDMLINSEANHHRKNRGYTTVLGVCDGEQVHFIKPTAEIKRYIKLHGGQDLMHETGDINAVIRMAVWLRRQSDLKLAIHHFINRVGATMNTNPLLLATMCSFAHGQVS